MTSIEVSEDVLQLTGYPNRTSTYLTNILFSITPSEETTNQIVACSRP